jgi:HK97 family phage major capsid protein
MDMKVFEDALGERDLAVKALFDKITKSFEGSTESITARLLDIEQKIARRGQQFSGSISGGEKSIGSTVVESSGFKAFVESGARVPVRIPIDTKAVVTIGSGITGAGPMTPVDRRLDPVILPRRPLMVRDLCSPGQTGASIVYFPRMTTRQNFAGVVSEGALKPQSDFATEIVQAPVRVIAHFIKTARQAMDDAPALMATVDGELRWGLAYAEEQQLLTGDGTGENLLGIIPQSTAYSAPFTAALESTIDRVLLGMIQAELALVPATGVVLNPLDWGKMRLTKNTLGDYLLGEPGDPVTQPVLWNRPVVVSMSMPVGHFLVGAFYTGCQIFDRQATEVLISTENQDDFITNKITIRCEERLAFAVKQPIGLIYGSLS